MRCEFLQLMAVIIIGFAAGNAAALAARAQPPQMADRLSVIRAQVLSLEQGLIDGVKAQKEARANIRRIQKLLQLQKQERELGKKRMVELEKTISELESRRGALREKVLVHQQLIRKSLADIQKSMNEQPKSTHLNERERVEAPRRRVLALLVDRSVKEIETLKIDLDDADQLEGRIQDERHQLAYLFQDLNEQESVLELNKQIQVDLIKQKHAERVSQLENYRKLKSSESQVEDLIRDFNARRELEKNVETERMASKAMMQGVFAKLQGKLKLPVKGEIISYFGRAFDAKSSLHVFKKGIDIATARNQLVTAITAGKVAYSGELPNYGKVTIIDHGNHFYSLCAHLGTLQKKVGDAVAGGDPIGASDDAGTPVYFEIRARNIAVNPLQWVSN